ncbi:MAG: polyhydroxyalkanoate depolymerase [Alphaproteobacteria bacterium]|nr:polyhydroxyalkanoate depolymerase [Alphaproteobacteria bacterium]
MNYHAYEFAHAMISPMRWIAQGIKMQMQMPFNPLSSTPIAKSIAAAIDVFEGVTRRYGKPEWDIDHVHVDSQDIPVKAVTKVRKPFCNLIKFERQVEEDATAKDRPDVLIVAPMSGHYATLLRGTVEAMMPEHDVYITDWIDARNVPVTDGRFDLDDYIDYVIDFTRFIGPKTHLIAVCQPSVPTLAATAVMAGEDDPYQPMSLTLMGGPIDTRRNPTAVNKLAEEKSMAWFEQNVISMVPFPNPGFMRRVYPGFVQLTGFMTMNLERHTKAHQKLFDDLVKGDCDSVAQHREFYEEYLAVMDLTAEFYLQTISTVFQEHALPEGTMMHRGKLVDCGKIVRTAILTIEGERDDITGRGQTEAAHDLCTNLALDEKFHYVQPGVGHYGVFNGRRWRTEIQPRVREFITSTEYRRERGARLVTTGNGLVNGHDPDSNWQSLQDDDHDIPDWDRAAIPQMKHHG